MGIWIRSQDRETISFEEKLYMAKAMLWVPSIVQVCPIIN